MYDELNIPDDFYLSPELSKEVDNTLREYEARKYQRENPHLTPLDWDRLEDPSKWSQSDRERLAEMLGPPDQTEMPELPPPPTKPKWRDYEPGALGPNQGLWDALTRSKRERAAKREA